MAGLLTYSASERLPIHPRQTGILNSGSNAPQHLREITAAGTVRDSHPVPYYPQPQSYGTLALVVLISLV